MERNHKLSKGGVIRSTGRSKVSYNRMRDGRIVPAEQVKQLGSKQALAKIRSVIRRRNV